jgi:hypothetical protein
VAETNPPVPKETSHPEYGDVVAKFRGTIGRNAVHIGMLFLGMGFFALVLVKMLVIDKLRVDQHAIGLLVMAGGVAACGFMFIRALVGADADLVLFTNGLMARKGSTLHEFKFDDIESVTESVTQHIVGDKTVSRVSHWIELGLKGRAKPLRLDLSFVPSSEEVSGIVHAATLPRLIEAATQALTARQELPYGKYLKLRSDGPMRRGVWGGWEFIPWGRIDAVSVEDGSLKITTRHDGMFPWYWWAVDQIPNFRVLLAILQSQREGTMPSDAARAVFSLGKR